MREYNKFILTAAVRRRSKMATFILQNQNYKPLLGAMTGRCSAV